MNKRKILFLAGGLLVIGLLAAYWLFVGNEDSLPEEEEIMAGINATLSNAEATEVQDFLKVGKNHGIAPFRSDNGGYSLSYWERNLTGWKVKAVRTDGEPGMWMVDEDDPSSFHIVWNIPPENRVKTLQYYFMRERGYSISGEEQHYVPGILMKMEVSMEEKTFGVKKLPREWVYAMTLSDGSERQGAYFWEEFSPGLHSAYGWIPLDAGGKEVEWKESMDSSSYYNGDIREEYMQRFSEEQLERGLF
ncbi:hypothetical protein CN378_17280 [Bacillus sp. AFS015802]|uniref:hypothetical protein n=1 Tax=Bacillus sp. AFS015802 TaxID=2033486 RepID=UPI000BF70E4F|nr:hypothetical protein [Bacillus sp. AFS015802]PFA62797.1 hypothetical protein CN378_17280 [Bacillus sp. AFS015802]